MTDTSKFIREAKAFEFYIKTIWPWKRKLVKRYYSKRCVRCTASERYSPLDEQGICRLCRDDKTSTDNNNLPPSDILTEQLHQTMASYVGKGQGDHDALVLVSGGKDSSYMVHRLHEEHPKLRLLTYTHHNGFMSSVALDNVQQVIGKLGVDHFFYRPRMNFMIRLFRYQLTHLGPNGGYCTVDYSDGELLLDSSMNLAVKLKIPLVICGYSRYQLLDGFGCDTFLLPDQRRYSDRKEIAGNALQDIFPNEGDQAIWWHASKWKKEQIPQMAFPLFAWDLAEEEIRAKVLQLGLLKAGMVSPVLTNAEYIPVLGVVDIHRDGYSSFEPEFSRMIREGKAKKENWQYIWEVLEYTARTGKLISGTIDQTLARLGLSRQDVGIKYQK
ncbi:hypothetical protein KAR10_07745 [bacterium]|nr:hypothetical protein [bacterium]